MADDRRARALLGQVKKGDIITADWLNSLSRAINDNTRNLKSPQNKTAVRDGNSGSGGGGSSIGNETFSAGSTDITNQTVEITDSNGDTFDIERITQIVFTEDSTGRTLTLNITYA